MEDFKNNIKKFDFPLFIAVMLLSVIGNILVASATASYSNGKTQVLVQIAATIIGCAAAFILAFWDYEFLAKKFGWIIAADVFMLVLVLILGIG